MREKTDSLTYVSWGNEVSVASFVISLVSLVVATIALFATWRKNVKDRQYANDKELVERLKQSLQLAYDSLAMENGHPVNDRLRWLTAARHIARYRKLSDELRTALFKNICEEQEEYWRNRIYVLLGKIESSGFYEAINTEQMVHETIEPRSAAIVHSFSVWKEGRVDPLDDMSFEDIVSKYKLFSPLHRHFEEYIKVKHPKLAEKVKETDS
jgi:hypothetical protein